MSRAAVLIVLGGLLLPGRVMAAPTVAWPEPLYNPKPDPADLIVPLPCGGAMAFRSVTTASAGPLADVEVELGSETESLGYAEHRYLDHLAGSFEAPEAGLRRFLLGKYEVTALQYAAVQAGASGGPCPEPGTGAAARLPKSAVGWHDAMTFAHDYSLWLRGESAAIADCDGTATPCLPRADGVPAFVRLPTEAEWEYAARGGDRVSPAVFREPLYPMPDGIERHVWFNETAQGQVRPIGVLGTNPLGLHDLLGNLEELVLDPFRLNRLERRHGQAGAAVVRGGSIYSTREDLRTSLRREILLYDERGAVGTADTGFRVLLAAPVLTSNQRIETVRAAWERLGSDSAKPQTAPPPRPALDDRPFDDPILELTALARASDEPVMTQRLERLRSVVAGTTQRLYEQRARSAREAMRFGGLLCEKLSVEGFNLDLLRQRLDLCVQNENAEHPRCRRLAEDLERDGAVLDVNIGVYSDSIVRTAQTYPDDLAVLETELTGLGAELAARGYGNLVIYPEQFHKDVVGYARSGAVARDLWFKGCRGLRD